MEWRDLIIDGYTRINDALNETLEGFDQREMDRQPKPDCNSMGWTAWHLTRVQDHEIGNLLGGDQLWLSAGWHEKFSRSADSEDTGTGDTSEQVAAFKSPGIDMFLDYHRVVTERTIKYLCTLKIAELKRKLDEPWFQPTPTVAVRVISVMADGLQHSGEMAYLRGLLKGKGWLGY